jgi:hypothetical protein
MKTLTCTLLLWIGFASFPYAEEAKVMQEQQFRDHLSQMDRQNAAPAKLRQALALLPKRWFSSFQVKAICSRLPGDPERLEFAIAAFPRVVDPENFYEVYDAFRTFSHVLRLHDQARGMQSPPNPAPVAALHPVSEDNLQQMLKSLRGEPFEDNRSALAKQILESSRRNFLARQVVEILKTFKFEDNRLEVAKKGYEAVLDPENYFLVHETLKFAQNREELAQYIRSRNPGQGKH